MNLVGSTWTIWSPLISTHGITLQIDILRLWTWHQLLTAWDEGRDLQKVVEKLPRRSFFGAFIREYYSWILVMRGNVYVRLFLLVSVYFICGFAKCLLCQFVSNCETTSGYFLFSFASLTFWKVICGSRLARHVIDDANRGCRAKITWQIRNNTNLLEESRGAKQKDQGHLNVLSDQDVKTCEKWNIGSWVQENILWIWHRSSKTKWVFLLNSTECFFQAQPWDSFNLRQV